MKILIRPGRRCWTVVPLLSRPSPMLVWEDSALRPCAITRNQLLNSAGRKDLDSTPLTCNLKLWVEKVLGLPAASVTRTRKQQGSASLFHLFFFGWDIFRTNPPVSVDGAGCQTPTTTHSPIGPVGGPEPITRAYRSVP